MPRLDRSTVTSRLRIPPRPERLDELPYRPRVTAGALAVCALLAVASLIGTGDGRLARLPLAVVVLLADVVAANGWTRVVDLPSRKGTAIVAVLAAVATSLSVLLAPDDRPLAWLPVALALAVVGAFGHQLLRTDGRPRVVTSLGGSLLAIGLLSAGACWVALPGVPGGRAAALATTAGLAAAAVVEGVLHRAGAWRVLLPVSMAVGGVVSMLVAVPLATTWWVGLVLGVLACAVAFSVRAMLAPLPQLTARRAQMVSATLSVLAAGAVALLVARAFPVG